MAEILKVIGQYGGFSAIVAVGFAYMCWKLYNQLNELQNQRVKESNELRTEMLNYSTAMNKALEGAAQAMTSLKDVIKDKSYDTEGALKDVCTAVDSMRDAVKSLEFAISSLKDLIARQDKGGAG